MVQLNIITIDGSITKETTVLENVDPSLTVLSVKILIQGKDSVPPQQRDTPPYTVQTTASTDNGKKQRQLHPDFERMFCNGKELVEDEKTLEDYGVEDGSCIRFAVSSSLAAELRTVLSTLIKKYPEDDIISEANASDDHKRDELLLGFVMNLYLKSYTRVRDAGRRRREARSRGENVEVPAKNNNLLGPTAMQKELYKIFDPSVLPVRFYLLSGGGVDGNTEYMGFKVEANKTNYRYKTCYGIPVTLSFSNRKPQLALQAGPETRNWAVPGFVTQDGTKMACTKHWALGVIVGCEVKTEFGTGTVRTIRHNEDIIVVDFA